MSKPISSYPEEMRDRVVARRARCTGLGGISAEAYKMIKGKIQAEAYAKMIKRDLEAEAVK